jgi:hypothetical protein
LFHPHKFHPFSSFALSIHYPICPISSNIPTWWLSNFPKFIHFVPILKFHPFVLAPLPQVHPLMLLRFNFIYPIFPTSKIAFILQLPIVHLSCKLPGALPLSSLSPSSFVIQYPQIQPLEKFIYHPNFPSNSICPTFWIQLSPWLHAIRGMLLQQKKIKSGSLAQKAKYTMLPGLLLLQLSDIGKH